MDRIEELEFWERG